MSQPRGPLHRVFAPVTNQLSLAGRVAVLTTLAVAMTLTLVSTTVFWTVHSQFINSLDEAMFKRAENAVIAGYRPARLTGEQAELLSIAGIQLLAITSGGGAFLLGTSEDVPYDDREREVAIGRTDRSARTADINGLPYRIVAVQAGPGQAFVMAQSMESTQAALDRLLQVLLFTSALGVLLAGLSGWAVASNGLRPVRRLTDAAERVARTAELTPIRVSGKKTDELARLTHSFNAMLQALDAVQRRERQLIADAGHELRTPLTSLRTNIDLLRQVSADPDPRLDLAERRELLEDISAQLVELSTLVGDLTELARDEPIRRDPEPLDLADVVERAVARVQLRSNEVTFESHLSPSLVLGDSQLLERAVTNLLDNASKWSPVSGTVTVGLHNGVLSVSDEGPGIAADDRAHVFERFWRADEARTLAGSGLGLSIVKRAADQHSGWVGVDSDLGHGSTFRFGIPVATSPDLGQT